MQSFFCPYVLNWFFGFALFFLPDLQKSFWWSQSSKNAVRRASEECKLAKRTWYVLSGGCVVVLAVSCPKCCVCVVVGSLSRVLSGISTLLPTLTRSEDFYWKSVCVLLCACRGMCCICMPALRSRFPCPSFCCVSRNTHHFKLTCFFEIQSTYHSSVEWTLFWFFEAQLVWVILLMLLCGYSLQVYEEGGINTSRPGTDPIHDQVHGPAHRWFVSSNH